MSRLASSCLGLLGALILAAPAHAQQAGVRAAAIADALREDPLYVSDSMARVATPDAVADLRATMARWNTPLYVVWAPFFGDEPGVDTPSDLLAQIRDRLGRPGVYVLADANGIGTEAARFGRARLAVDPLDAMLATGEDVPYFAPAPDRARYLLDVMRTGQRPQRGAGDREEARRDREEEAAEDGPDPLLRAGAWSFGIVTVLAWLIPVGWHVRRRRRAVPAPSAFVAPAADGDTARAASEAVERLVGRVDAAAAPPPAAINALAAARHVLDDPRRRPVDLVGVQALARTGERALDGETDPRPCFFDPRHPPGTETVRYDFDGQAARIPACRECASRVRHDAPITPAFDDGRPYWEHDTIWARTGFGALDPDLARDVLAGKG